jgi:eukaryotic-like serine/threonine-protein kinase
MPRMAGVNDKSGTPEATLADRTTAPGHPADRTPVEVHAETEAAAAAARAVAAADDHDDRHDRQAAEWDALLHEPPPGRRIGRFILLGKLGAGGMGVVLSAHDPVLDRKVALKILRPERRAGGGSQGRERLLREAKAMARLSHPNVVTVHEAGIADDQVYLAMELVEGKTLRAWLAERPRPWREIVRAFLAAGRGLAAAHRAGLVHRDFKPDNVLMADDGRVQVTDFGLVGEAGAEPPAPGVASPSLAPLTRTGTVMGTPVYMSPEQHQGKPVDARSDQFSFCVALHEALEGQTPFPAATPQELRARVLGAEPAPASRMPAWMRPAVRRGLTRDPGARFPSMDALLQALARDPGPRRRRAAIAFGAVAVAAAAAVVLVRTRDRSAAVCAAAGDRAAQAWNPALAARLRTAFLASGKPYAAGTFARVDRILDGYAAAWKAMRVEACAAAQVRHEQSPALMDLRMTCLDRRLDQVEALTTVLIHGDDPLVLEKAVPSALTLERLDGCADAAALLAAVAPPAPALRAKVEEVRRKLAGLHAKTVSGWGHKELPAEAGALVAEARAVPYPPLLGEALAELGRAQMEVRADKQAEQSLDEAAHAAAAAKDDRQLATTLSDLMFVIGIWEGRDADALALRLPAELALERSGGDLRARGKLLHTVGAILNHAGRWGEGQRLLEEAVTVNQHALGAESSEVARVLTALGRALVDQGKLGEARQVFARARAVCERTVGPDHPTTALLDQQTATLLWKLEDYPAAEAAERRALATLEQAYGPENPKAIGALQDLAMLLSVQHRFDEARPLYARVIVLREKVMGEDPDLSVILDNYGAMLNAEGKHAEALPVLQRAVAMAEKGLGADHYAVGVEKMDLGDALAGTGRLDEGLALQRRAYQLLQRKLGETADLADAACKLVRTLLAAGPAGAAEALPVAEQAAHIADGQEVPPLVQARARFALARALDALHRDPDRALGLARQSRAGYADHPHPGEVKALTEVEAWLARRQAGAPAPRDRLSSPP